jgi:hypothetical protein
MFTIRTASAAALLVAAGVLAPTTAASAAGPAGAIVEVQHRDVTVGVNCATEVRDRVVMTSPAGVVTTSHWSRWTVESLTKGPCAVEAGS